MSNLGRRKNFNIQSETIYQALTYFEKKLSEIEFLILELTARHAFSDDHLFEMFEMWNNAELSDDGFLFQIKEYQSADVLPPLAESDRDLSGKFSEIEKLKKNIDTDFSSHFAKTLQMLAAKNGLSTNEKLGEFLGMSAEQARVLCLGTHKPQRKTLLRISERFGVPIEHFLDDLSSVRLDVSRRHKRR